jgi:hypothetical protein
MHNPYAAPDAGLRLGPRLADDGGAVPFLELPRACPRCNGKVKKPMKFKRTRQERIQRFLGVLVAIGVFLVSSLLQILLLQLWSWWLAMIPAVLVGVGIARAAQRLPKLGVVRCGGCRWEELYLVQLHSR